MPAQISDPGGEGPTAPVRTCIGCRERCSRGDLLRVVARDGVVQPDPQAHLAGRGAWLHPGCLGVAQRRRAFARALRQAGPLDLRPLQAWVEQAE
jgi:predicted RNA-binding protein YlxR (DUF448 family)